MCCSSSVLHLKSVIWVKSMAVQDYHHTAEFHVPLKACFQREIKGKSFHSLSASFGQITSRSVDRGTFEDYGRSSLAVSASLLCSHSCISRPGKCSKSHTWAAFDPEQPSQVTVISCFLLWLILTVRVNVPIQSWNLKQMPTCVHKHDYFNLQMIRMQQMSNLASSVWAFLFPFCNFSVVRKLVSFKLFPSLWLHSFQVI